MTQLNFIYFWFILRSLYGEVLSKTFKENSLGIEKLNMSMVDLLKSFMELKYVYSEWE